MGMMPESESLSTRKIGEGTFRLTENPSKQSKCITITKPVIDEAIAANLDLSILSSTTTKTFCVADLGCSVGPNTFHSMDNIIRAVKRKFTSQGLASDKMPEFQVYFNDIAYNNFNRLFISLPIERQYFPVGVPGSFYGRLFPESSLHFVHSHYALHWLSQVPEEVLDEESPAWNKGRIHYCSATEAVVKAFETQFAKDMGLFLDCRAKELVEGGMMVLTIPSIMDGSSRSNGVLAMSINHVGSCLMDMVEEGLIFEDLVNSFNIPIYEATPEEIKEMVERNGSFGIERIESIRTYCTSNMYATANAFMMHFKTSFEEIINKHFEDEMFSDELIDRCLEKIDDYIKLLRSNGVGYQITVILKRK